MRVRGLMTLSDTVEAAMTDSEGSGTSFMALCFHHSDALSFRMNWGS